MDCLIEAYVFWSRVCILVMPRKTFRGPEKEYRLLPASSLHAAPHWLRQPWRSPLLAAESRNSCSRWLGERKPVGGKPFWLAEAPFGAGTVATDWEKNQERVFESFLHPQSEKLPESRLFKG